MVAACGPSAGRGAGYSGADGRCHGRAYDGPYRRAHGYPGSAYGYAYDHAGAYGYAYCGSLVGSHHYPLLRH